MSSNPHALAFPHVRMPPLPQRQLFSRNGRANIIRGRWTEVLPHSVSGMAIKNAFTSNTRKPETLFFSTPWACWHLSSHPGPLGHKSFSSRLQPLLWAEVTETGKNCYLGRARFFEKVASQVLLIMHWHVMRDSCHTNTARPFLGLSTIDICA